MIDFFVAKGFLTAPPARISGPVNAAAFALVRRVVPLFSSFSLVTPRCRIERAYGVNVSIQNVESEAKRVIRLEVEDGHWLLTGGILMIYSETP